MSSQGFRRMGTAQASAMLLTNGISSPTRTKSQVLAFHSSSKWKAHFEASKATAKLMVVDFTASWCVPCRQMEPILEEFSIKYPDVEFIKIDVDELMGVSSEYGVYAMPTSILIKQGRAVDKVTGVKKEELQLKIEKHRN